MTTDYLKEIGNLNIGSSDSSPGFWSQEAQKEFKLDTLDKYAVKRAVEAYLAELLNLAKRQGKGPNNLATAEYDLLSIAGMSKLEGVYVSKELESVMRKMDGLAVAANARAEAATEMADDLRHRLLEAIKRAEEAENAAIALKVRYQQELEEARGGAG